MYLPNKNKSSLGRTNSSDRWNIIFDLFEHHSKCKFEIQIKHSEFHNYIKQIRSKNNSFIYYGIF